MTVSPRVPIAPTPRATDPLTVIGVALVLAAIPANARGQGPSPAKSGWEFVVPAGSLIPVGAQRDAIKRANMNAAQLSYVVRPSVAVTATAGWARSRDIRTADNPKVDAFLFDLGTEVRGFRWRAGAWSFHSFAGAGGGMRTYDYRGLRSNATHNLAGYGGAGGELGLHRVRLRLEARNYVTGFKPLNGEGEGATRNDVVLLAGLRLASR